MTTPTLTSALAAGFRRLPDRILADAARSLDDRSLCTLIVTLQKAEVVAYRAMGSVVPGTVAPAATRAPSGVTGRVDELIRAQPGIGAREIRRALTNDTATGIRKALARLRGQGRVRREGCTSDSRYFPTLHAVGAVPGGELAAGRGMVDGDEEGDRHGHA